MRSLVIDRGAFIACAMALLAAPLAAEVQQVDLHHLRDVLEEMRGLAQREEPKEGDPPSRDEPVGKRRRARRHR